MEPIKTWFTTAEAATYTGMHRDTLLRAAADGELLSQQRSGKNGRRRYRREWLDAFIAGEAPALVASAS